MDECHIPVCMCHRIVAQTSDVTSIFAIGLRGLKAIPNHVGGHLRIFKMKKNQFNLIHCNVKRKEKKL